MAQRFVYKPASPESIREKANMKSGDFDRIVKSEIPLYKARDGKNKIRIIPPTWDDNPDNYYGYIMHVVYGVGPDKTAYLSRKMMLGEADPLDEAYKAAARDGDEALAKNLKPKKRVAIWVIDRLAEDEGPKLWVAPFTVTRDFASLSFDDDTSEHLMIDHPNEGYDIKFEKSGTGLKTEYDAAKMRIDREPSPLHSNEKTQDKWLAYVVNHPIPDCLQFYDYKHISEVFNGAPPREDEDDTPRKPMTRAGKVIKHDEDGEVEEDDVKASPKATARPGNDDDEDEAEAAASSLRAKLAARKAAAAVDDDDDEEEVQPRKRLRA